MSVSVEEQQAFRAGDCDVQPSERPPPTPEPATFVVNVRHDSTPRLVQVFGELDMATAPLLTAMLEHVRTTQRDPITGAREDAPMRIDVDLSRVTFADSHGMASVLDDHAVVLVAASGRVRRILDVLRP